MLAVQSKPLLQKFADLCKDWQNHQEEACKHLSQLVNIEERLPILSDLRSYEGLTEQENFRKILIQKQLHVQGRIWKKLLISMEEFSKIVKSYEKLVAESAALARKERASQSKNVKEIISINSFAEYMTTVWRQYRDELLLKMAILSLIQEKKEPLSTLTLLFKRQPNLEISGALPTLFDLVAVQNLTVTDLV